MTITLPVPTARFDIAMQDGAKVRVRRFGNAAHTPSPRASVAKLEGESAKGGGGAPVNALWS